MKKVFKHFKFLKVHWRLLLIVFVCGVAVSLMEGVSIGLLFPVMQGSKQISNFKAPVPFDKIVLLFQGLGLVARVKIVVLLLVGITGLKTFFLFFQNIMVARLQWIICQHFQVKCAKQLMRLNMNYINNNKGSDLYAIVYSHAYNIGASLSMLGKISHLPCTIIVLLVMLFIISWKVAIVSLVLAFLLSFAIKGLLRKSDLVSRGLSKAISSYSATLLDIISGIKVIKLFKKEDCFADRFRDSASRYNGVMFDITRLRGAVGPGTQFLGVAMIAIIAIVFLGIFPQEGSISVLFIFLVAFSRTMTPIVTINQTRVKFIGDLPYYREVFSFLERKDYIKDGEKMFQSIQDNIQFKNLTFAYKSQETTVLSDVSFSVERGKKIGVVGPSGAGKSTITELLLRFYDPQQGAILVDGIDLRELNILSWRKKIGVVSQDVYLFNDTIKANIAFTNLEASLDDIKDAAKKAHAHQFIELLPKGYDTFIGDRGVLLSGGQRQRIAIARAIALNPDILVFDEATSALDTESERIVQKTLEEVGQGRTVISIAHRISTVFDSDEIIVIDDGRIVEHGHHEQLLAKQGLYNKLVQMQQLETKIHSQNSIMPQKQGDNYD